MAFIAPIVAPLFSFLGANAAGFATAAAFTSAASSLISTVESRGGRVTSLPSPNILPPSQASIQAAESARLLKATQAQTKTILTSPLGVSNPQDSKKKLLLGA